MVPETLAKSGAKLSPSSGRSVPPFPVRIWVGSGPSPVSKTRNAKLQIVPALRAASAANVADKQQMIPQLFLAKFQ